MRGCGHTSSCVATPLTALEPFLRILSTQSFQGRHGRAYLFNNVVNVTLGPKEDRLLITGLHSVCDIYCTCCQSVLGWKYVSPCLPANNAFSRWRLAGCPGRAHVGKAGVGAGASLRGEPEVQGGEVYH